MSAGDHIPGWMLSAELEWLFEQAARARSVLEIGSWLGRSTYALCASGCPSVWAVDSFQDFRKEPHSEQCIVPEGVEPFTQFFRHVGHFRNLHIVPFSSEEAAGTLLGGFDFVFIDGCHEYESVMFDIATWGPRAKVLAGHDFKFDGVRRAVTKSFSYKGSRSFELPVGSIWMREEIK